MKTPRLFVPLNAVTATTTSDPFDIENADKVTFEFTRANHSAGSSAFAVEVSVDGVNWVTFNKLIDNVTNTNAQNLTRVASASLASNTSKHYSMDLASDSFRLARVTVTETTDGTHTCKAHVLYNY